MKIKLKLSLLVIIIMAVAVAGLAVLILRQASAISTDLSMRGIKNLAGQRAEYWKGNEDGYIRVLRTLANIMSDYESLPPETRRDNFDAILQGTIEMEPDIINLYTVWRPNALDGMDEQYIGRVGSGPNGQYAIGFTRETGRVLPRTSIDIEDSMDYITGPGSKRDRVDPPFTRNDGGKETHLFRMMVPIINPRTNETVGGVGCLLSIDMMQPVLERIVHEHEEITMMVIYANDGFILAHVYPERIGKMMADVDVEFGKNKQAALEAIRNGKNNQFNVYDPVFGSNVELIMQPFRIGNSDTTWTVMIGSADSYILKEVNDITMSTIILSVIAIVITALIIFFVLGYFTKPIVTVTNTLKDISEGEGDLTRTIPVKGNDEIADMSRYFNLTLDKIKNLVVVIKRQTITLYNTSQELSSNMTETAAAVNEITANIQSIKGRVMNQSASVTETNATMEQITLNIDQVNAHIEKQAASVSRSSSAIEEMLANIRSVTDTLVKNAGNVKNLSSASEVGRTDLEDMAQDIQNIAKESEGLLEINAVMQNIASQTNLLSMNAAIEAAHAGEAGKGFAVVADEIRKLAESSSDQSKTISVVLKKIKGSIDKISASTDNVITEFGAISSGVKIVADQEENIRNAMEEQGEGSKQILEAVSELNGITRLVKDGSNEMRSGSREVIKESKNLEQVTQEISGSMNEMATGADQINTAVTRVNDICAKNKEDIELLVSEVSRFKVE